ncbi:hypothetical protein SSPNP10_05805 [Streptomyces sp. NP10]|nr:hypothetical protein SSPNP10_05805 [Streptomyces sp. NP10]
MPDQQLSDAELAAQPAAYWTGVAHEALIAYTRERQAEKGYTQPQFWLLRNLSAADISPDGAGMTLPELQRAMASYIRPEDDLAVEAEALVRKGRRGGTRRTGCGSRRRGSRRAWTSSATLPRSAPRSTRGSPTRTTSPP